VNPSGSFRFFLFAFFALFRLRQAFGATSFAAIPY
jgi:hypothetical protein